MRKDRTDPRAPQNSTAKFGHNPFRGLKAPAKPTIAAPQSPKSRAAESAKPVSPDDGNSADLFLRAVAGAQPLHEQQRQRVEHPPPATPAREITEPDAEALAELCDLVSGHAPFDIEQTEEHIEGAVVGLDRRVLRKLRSGEFAYQAHLDLHGMNAEEARVVVERFLTQSYQQGKRCVLIVHGRGLNSKDQMPVLKTRLTGWLARGQWSRWVLAFTSARAHDGGAGALYVLLRRQRDKRQPIRVTNGAKW
ncbi:MAG TPA: Smr/MutS family protein [Candidatus Acidoferrales bacterium]|nr:Smr/MutS family protein [Candidatus Acidoferrales bacterium]